MKNYKKIMSFVAALLITVSTLQTAKAANEQVDAPVVAVESVNTVKESLKADIEKMSNISDSKRTEILATLSNASTEQEAKEIYAEADRLNQVIKVLKDNNTGNFFIKRVEKAKTLEGLENLVKQIAEEKQIELSPSLFNKNRLTTNDVKENAEGIAQGITDANEKIDQVGRDRELAIIEAKNKAMEKAKNLYNSKKLAKKIEEAGSVEEIQNILDNAAKNAEGIAQGITDANEKIDQVGRDRELAIIEAKNKAVKEVKNLYNSKKLTEKIVAAGSVKEVNKIVNDAKELAKNAEGIAQGITDANEKIDQVGRDRELAIIKAKNKAMEKAKNLYNSKKLAEKIAAAGSLSEINRILYNAAKNADGIAQGIADANDKIDEVGRVKQLAIIDAKNKAIDRLKNHKNAAKIREEIYNAKSIDEVTSILLREMTASTDKKEETKGEAPATSNDKKEETKGETAKETVASTKATNKTNPSTGDAGILASVVALVTAGAGVLGLSKKRK